MLPAIAFGIGLPIAGLGLLIAGLGLATAGLGLIAGLGLSAGLGLIEGLGLVAGKESGGSISGNLPRAVGRNGGNGGSISKGLNGLQRASQPLGLCQRQERSLVSPTLI